jgi:hypothetical protein
LVKNITVSVPDDIYRQARIKAAERDTSASALVRDFLAEIAGGESDFERRARIQAETIAGIRKFSASGRLTREQAHQRDALRRH